MWYATYTFRPAMCTTGPGAVTVTGTVTATIRAINKKLKARMTGLFFAHYQHSHDSDARKLTLADLGDNGFTL